MAKIPLVMRSFEGGWGTDLKLGLKNSFAFSQNMDFRSSPSQLTLLPATAREDTNVVKDLIQNEVMVLDGTIYAIGSSGNFYKRTTAGVWSVEAQLSSGNYGINYRKDTDAIYIPTNKSVALFNPVSSSPALTPTQYAQSFSTYNNSTNAGFNVSANQVGSQLLNPLQTIAINTTFQETQTQQRFFQSDIEPLTKISVWVNAKGTGDWTLTLHDGLNTVLATATVANANLVNGQFNDFVFSNATNGQVRIYVAPNARTYHFHLTSTVADGTILGTQANQLNNCDVQVWADRLIQTTNGMHPWARFLQYEIIGNGNYLSAWEPLTEPPTNAEWQRHRLVFPQEYEVCGIAVFNEYLAIACEKVVTNSPPTPAEGIIFFWDGLAPTYNYLTKIPEGSPQCIHEYKNVIYYYANKRWYAIGSPRSLPLVVRQMPQANTDFSGVDDNTRIYPYAATVRNGIHLMAYPSTTTNTSIQYGIYSWGHVDKNFPESFGYNYLISTGSQNYSSSNHLTIGMVKNFGNLLHISWRDDLNGGYGIDKVDNSSAPAATGYWQSLVFDNGYPAKTKKASHVQCTFTTLPSGGGVQLQYKLDREANWHSSSVFSTSNLYDSNSNYARFDVDAPSTFREIQVGLVVTATTTTPTITSVSLVFDDDREQGLT